MKLAVVLASAWALVLAAAADPDRPTPATGVIAYSVSHPLPSGEETRHICLLDPQTGRTQRLTHESNVIDYLPAWSPAGVLAFTRRFHKTDGIDNIFRIDSNGSSLRLLRRGAVNVWASWSPDGTQIVYAHGYRGFELRVMNADGSGDRRLGPAGPVSDPVWSPDGTRIMYTKGIPPALWVVVLDGRGDRMLLDNASGGRWSPEGGRIAFTRLGGNNRRSHIWVTTADGASERQLTAAPASDTSPAWSPDGSEVVFERGDDLYVISADGGAERRLLTTRLSERSPAWSGLEQSLGGPPCAVLGSARRERLRGAASSDYVYGGRGDDEIRTGRGRDVALGEHGADLIRGGAHADVLGGGPGRDRLYGDAGPDALYGGPADDLVVGGPGRDFIRCGPGRDRVVLEHGERAGRDCEVQIRSG